MKVLFTGAYEDAEITLAPIKVGRELFRNLANNQIEVVYLCYFDDGSKYTRIQKLFGFEKVNKRVYRSGIFPFLFFVIKYKPDIIQIVTPGAYYLPVFLLKSILKFKVTYLSHSIISYSLKNFLRIGCYQKLRLRTIERIVLKYSDSLQILSKVEARFLIKYLKVKNEKIRIVDNGINMFGYKKFYNESSELIKIICIGSLKRKEKSFELLFEALSKINNPVQLSIFDYEEQKQVNLKLPANVQIFFGKPLIEAGLREEFCKNDLCIVPSKYEPFSLSLLEAMGTGILFISTNRVGLTSRFPDSFNKFLVPYGNAEKLKDKILELHCMDNARKNQMAEKIITFSSHYTWDLITDYHLEIYYNLVQTKLK